MPSQTMRFRPSGAPGLSDRASGFSLLELILVMAMVGLLFTVVTVSVSRSLTGAEIRAAASDLLAGLRHTRGQAIIQRQQQVFIVDAEARTWQAAGREPVQIPEGMDITINTARSELTGERAGGIRFYPDGASTGGSVVLTAGEREWHVSVGWLTGEIGIERDPQV
ncbi:GspH/FimT family pseudopilin [Wenzhouxiangella marina]|uniref:Type II secretion system protein H n=1 Tax=Wenzhouxiangella marina TaxID=1579979 RepID=A0A0K0XTB7_9GAMM|nr:GspH/FimT family pseudopilin [Wenzhouxiangella marina]AKS40867.1 General secretion pathway protein H [Wenzhouxiangella marina]MBB6087741.1 general secretion pathway protein H [Wenzhouxiangella marina]